MSTLEALTGAISAWVKPLLRERQRFVGNGSSWVEGQKEEVSVVALQSLEKSQNPQEEIELYSRGRNFVPRRSRIWISSPAALNLEHLLLRRRRDVSIARI